MGLGKAFKEDFCGNRRCKASRVELKSSQGLLWPPHGGTSTASGAQKRKSPNYPGGTKMKER